MADAALKQELKVLVIEECDKEDLTPEDISDDQPLVGGDLELDSLDVLQICMAVKTRYGVRIEGSTDARRCLASINALAETIEERRN